MQSGTPSVIVDWLKLIYMFLRLKRPQRTNVVKLSVLKALRTVASPLSWARECSRAMRCSLALSSYVPRAFLISYIYDNFICCTAAIFSAGGKQSWSKDDRLGSAWKSVRLCRLLSIGPAGTCCVHSSLILSGSVENINSGKLFQRAGPRWRVWFHLIWFAARGRTEQ